MSGCGSLIIIGAVAAAAAASSRSRCERGVKLLPAACGKNAPNDSSTFRPNTRGSLVRCCGWLRLSVLDAFSLLRGVNTRYPLFCCLGSCVGVSVPFVVVSESVSCFFAFLSDSETCSGSLMPVISSGLATIMGARPSGLSDDSFEGA